MNTKPHREIRDDGDAQGRDPRAMSRNDLTACGLERQSRGDAIRSKCIDCMGGSPPEVRRCAAVDCPLWPFRMGTDPWREPMAPERRAELAERMRGMRPGA